MHPQESFLKNSRRYYVPLADFSDGIFKKIEKKHTVLFCRDEDDATQWFEKLNVKSKIDLRNRNVNEFLNTYIQSEARATISQSIEKSTPIYTLVDVDQATGGTCMLARSYGFHLVPVLSDACASGLDFETVSAVMSFTASIGLTAKTNMFTRFYDQGAGLSGRPNGNALYLYGWSMK